MLQTDVPHRQWEWKTETADLGGRAHVVGTVSATVEGGPAYVTAAPGGGGSSLERPRQHCFLWAGVASWDGGSCEVLLGLQNLAESSISVKVPPALAVPSDPPQSTCWEKPSLHHQQVRLQHRPRTAQWVSVGHRHSPSDTAKLQGGQGAPLSRVSSACSARHPWCLWEPGSPPTQVLSGSGGDSSCRLQHSRSPRAPHKYV